MIGAVATRSTPAAAFPIRPPQPDSARAPEPVNATAPQTPARPSPNRPLLSGASIAPLQQADTPTPLEEARAGAEPAEPVTSLNSEEQAVIADLRARDQEVRAHEAAHARVGGEFAGAPSFTFETGPDGRLYAVAGEVSIDTSPVPGDPEASIEKLETVIRAALAPAEPSSQDLAVAAQARARLAEARAEARSQASEEQQGGAGADAFGGEAVNDGLIGALRNLLA